MDLLFGPFYGFSVNPMDTRPLSDAELGRMYAAQLHGMMQAQQDPRHWELYRNWQPFVDSRPLDERFADFKVRLAKAIERHKRANDLNPACTQRS